MSVSAIHLQDQASMLRTLAARLERVPIDAAVGLAGPDTWRGPSVDECADDLRRQLRRLHDVADDLRRQAVRLELEAGVRTGR